MIETVLQSDTPVTVTENGQTLGQVSRASVLKRLLNKEDSA